MVLLLREAIGDGLRRARTARRRTLRDVSGAARVSLGYLSEVERGRKEASSELLAAICQALDLPLPELLDAAAHRLRPSAFIPVGTGPAELDRADWDLAGLDEGRPVESTARDAQSDLRLAPALSRSLPVRVGGDHADVADRTAAAGVVAAA